MNEKKPGELTAEIEVKGIGEDRYNQKKCLSYEKKKPLSP